MSLRILHISDFHLNRETRLDYEKYFKNSFIEDVSKQHSLVPFDLILFTGDIVDMGGKDFGGCREGFDTTNQLLFQPLISAEV